MDEKHEGISCYLVFYIFIFKSFNVCSLMYVAFQNRKTRLFFDFAYQDMQNSYQILCLPHIKSPPNLHKYSKNGD